MTPHHLFPCIRTSYFSIIILFQLTLLTIFVDCKMPKPKGKFQDQMIAELDKLKREEGLLRRLLYWVEDQKRRLAIEKMQLIHLKESVSNHSLNLFVH